MHKNTEDKNWEFKYHKERLDQAFKLLREYNHKASHMNRMDDTFLMSLDRYLRRRRVLTTKQHLALEEFIERFELK